MKHLTRAVLIVGAVLAVWFAATFRPADEQGLPRTDTPSVTTPANAPPVVQRPDSRQASGSHPLADLLGTPGIPPEKEPGIALELLEAVRRLEGRFPVAEDNAGLVRQLTQPRNGQPALMPARHPRITAGGEWSDGWGTPYFFHHISGNYLEIRSAGPDRQMYTDDDILVPPPRPAP